MFVRGKGETAMAKLISRENTSEITVLFLNHVDFAFRIILSL